MNKPAFLLKWAQDIRASYWFIPAVMVIVAIALSYASQWIDHNVDLLPFALPDALINTQIEGARSTLSVIATSVIGVTGVMFSMTILAVSFAAGNYGPRLIGNFMRDRGNQISLGILIATFVYTLMILRAVQDPSESGGIDAFVPQYSMLIAVAGCLLAVFTMIYFVHHVPETINVSNITASLGAKLEAAITAMIDAEEDLPDAPVVDFPDREADHSVRVSPAGFIQTLDYRQIETICEDHDWQIEIVKIPGDFVTSSTVVLRIWADDGFTEKHLSDIQECFAIGSSRTENQNIFFLADELVEMLARALSPGVNDPFTAINCLNWMYNSMTVAERYKGGLGEEGARKSKLGPHLTRDALFKRCFLASKPYCETDHLAHEHYKTLVARVNAG
ncbi:DUF2254 domain-containing protein [Litoreibacter albidus]|uniref:Predicted membrane protein n=1 Tax=Litoreibacter albidus TaxID=670155 RepID=A0A1H3BTE3_9RHOB|nr:DUF2254 domain-containing protein [Litoreibacter albidus]SDX45292.1 Predicted membrane protein [Litoreibacter albidus]